jgi:hypothetical protein
MSQNGAEFENGRRDSRSARHTMEGCERNMSGENYFLAADATLGGRRFNNNDAEKCPFVIISECHSPI